MRERFCKCLWIEKEGEIGSCEDCSYRVWGFLRGELRALEGGFLVGSERFENCDGHGGLDGGMWLVSRDCMFGFVNEVSMSSCRDIGID